MCPEDEQDNGSPPTPNPHEVTVLLGRWGDGDSGALEELLPVVYSELERLAGAYMRRERAGHTLQTSALINEAYMRLVAPSDSSFESRGHFFAAAANTMRRVLVDHARRHQASKRANPLDKVTYVESADPAAQSDVDVLDLHEALEQLAEINERQAKVVELRYFGGLTQEETAQALGISVPSVARDWRVARMMLRRLLEDDAES